ncbi:EscU/YscU/HrcU family type III secretion system export apparatus switch protein [Candidatus Uabimicrobium amorphum]|uniref:Flagellar biosynthetic protein FlhB n=1 Tax=Uabimicrobium amorphum TaxID=2596890 RepID=A0A5S9INK1_UABAM|nr:EscU/YscU/HrcU family type III secretion system export apparatus switch protein [Candidatus Uabimicrobium amorphum]BBM85004.1 flagellar biosynthetic protein FlhB [Candidatus Uabimicrobium amorphum]
MSDEKTEQPTDKKRQDAIKKGNLTRSKDLDAALLLLSVALFIQAVGPFIVTQLQLIIKDFFSIPSSFVDRSIDETWLAQKIFRDVMTILLPITGFAAVITIIIGGAQTKFAVFEEKVKFSLDKLDVVKNVQNMFSISKAAQPFLIIAKTLVIVTVSYFVVVPIFYLWLAGYPANVDSLAFELGTALQKIVLYSTLMLVFIGAVDYAVQWRQRENKLKMSKQEIKDEWKQENGSPEIKQKRSQAMFLMAHSRAMQEVPGATVVVTNPTTFAIAIFYSKEKSPVPKVVAKGKGYLAQKIRSIANENEVPIVENKPLARSLYSLVEPGQEIPEQFYQAMASVLVYVFSKKKVK